MPPISDELRILLWIIVGIAAVVFGIFTYILQPNLSSKIRRLIPFEERRGRKPKKRSNLVWFLFFLTGSISIVGAAIASTAPTQIKTEQMVGDFRVAVAGFKQVGDSQEKELGVELAKGVHLRFEQNLSDIIPGLIITVWGPEKVGVVGGENREIRAKEAARISDEIDADMIIYGVVDTSQSIWQVRPEFYISGKNFYEAEEIVGQYEMGSSISLPGQDDISGRVELGDQMSDRTQVLSRLTIGLAYYAIRDYDKALELFLATESIHDWDDDHSKKVIYLLIGNAAGKLKDTVLAKEYYKNALDLDPEYARLYVGLGSASYIEAFEPFEKSNDPKQIDVDLVNDAISKYLYALQATNKPALSDIESKVHFGLGQSYLLREFSRHNPNFDLAISEFQAVIEEYDGGVNPRIIELAAEAHARLGLIYDLVGKYSQAVEEYENAASLLFDHPERQAQYLLRAKSIGEAVQ